MKTSSKRHRSRSFARFMNTANRGIPDELEGLDSAGLSYKIRGLPVIEVLDTLDIPPQDTSAVETRPRKNRKRLGRRGVGYNPLEIEYEKE